MAPPGHIYNFYILRFRNALGFRNTEHRTVGLNFFVQATEPSNERTIFPDYASSNGRINNELHNSSCAMNDCASISTMLVVPLV